VAEVHAGLMRFFLYGCNCGSDSISGNSNASGAMISVVRRPPAPGFLGLENPPALPVRASKMPRYLTARESCR